jgi:uncharacterized SAM-binding protein YcdF (DUF218 family)
VSVLSIAKLIGAPGSIPFFLVAVGAGLLLMLRARWRRPARFWLVGVAVTYVFLGMPVVANTIAAGLPAFPSNNPAAWRGIDTLIVLDGDNRRGRVRQAREVYEVAKPAEVWVFGDAWMLDPLLQSGVPYDRIKFGGDTANTRDQMARVKAFVDRHRRAAVIASRLQMPRIAALALSLDLMVPLIESPIDDEPPTTGIAQFVPSYVGLRTSRDALYELAAIRYYAWRGWIALPAGDGS